MLIWGRYEKNCLLLLGVKDFASTGRLSGPLPSFNYRRKNSINLRKLFLAKTMFLCITSWCEVGAMSDPKGKKILKFSSHAGIFQNALHGALNPSEVVDVPAIEPLDLRPPKKPKRKVTPSGTIVVSPEPSSRSAPAASSAAGSTGKAAVSVSGARQPSGEKLGQERVWISAQELQRLQWRLVDGGDLEDEAWELPSMVGLRCAACRIVGSGAAAACMLGRRGGSVT